MALRARNLALLAVAAALHRPLPLLAQNTPACDDEPTFHQLDFWLGEWSVIDSAGVRQGSSRIERILDGCAITPGPDGRVRQHIEISTDGGATWRTTFDAFYVPDPTRRSPDQPWPPPPGPYTLFPAGAAGRAR